MHGVEDNPGYIYGQHKLDLMGLNKKKAQSWVGKEGSGGSGRSQKRTGEKDECAV